MGRVSASLLVIGWMAAQAAGGSSIGFEPGPCGSHLGAGIETLAHAYKPGSEEPRDAVYVTNVRAHGGKHALLVDRYGENACNYSRVVNFDLRKLDPSRPQSVSFWFYPEGRGIASINFETTVYAKGNAMLFRAGLSNGGYLWHKTGDVVRLGTWHRLKIDFPAAGDKQGKVVFTAERPVDGKLAVVWRTETAADVKALSKGYGNLRFWFHKDRSGQRVYLDDVSF